MMMFAADIKFVFILLSSSSHYITFHIRIPAAQYARQSAVYCTQGFIMQSGQKSENKVSSVTVQFSILYSWSGLIVQIMLVCDKQQQMKFNVAGSRHQS